MGAAAEVPAARWRCCLRKPIAKTRVQSGMKERPIAPRSPWQNPYAERVIGSIRRECSDHVVVLDERHHKRLLRSYFA